MLGFGRSGLGVHMERASEPRDCKGVRGAAGRRDAVSWLQTLGDVCWVCRLIAGELRKQKQ